MSGTNSNLVVFGLVSSFLLGISPFPYGESFGLPVVAAYAIPSPPPSTNTARRVDGLAAPFQTLNLMKLFGFGKGSSERSPNDALGSDDILALELNEELGAVGKKKGKGNSLHGRFLHLTDIVSL